MSDKLILICDDEELVHKTVGEYLKTERMNYISAYDGLDSLNKAKILQPDLILLDITMPKIFGTEVCREIRKNSDVPIIMLTAKSEIIDKIICLELGADDYITKPFSPREVVTRIKTVLRRSNNFVRTNKCLKYEDLEINIETYEVYVKGKKVKITPKEIKIFYMLASNPGRILNREEILSEVWGYGYLGDTRVVDTHMKRLRKKLLQENLNWSIRSVYRLGYKFEIN
jgi:DNA-binding response OmpR family regulator